MHSGGDCTCGKCPHGAREGHRQAVAAFVALREEFAAGRGVPSALAHSAGASRQWVSDELALSARALAERGAAEGGVWMDAVRRRTLLVMWGGAAALLLGQALTAIGGRWTTGRTAGLAAAVVLVLALTAVAWVHRSRGGLLAPLIGEDNRLSTSRVVAAAWVLPVVYAVLSAAVELAVTSGTDDRRHILDDLELPHGVRLFSVLAMTCAVAVLVRRVVCVRVHGRRLQKVRAERPRLADLLTDDGGRGAFTDAQYVLINAVAVIFTIVLMARHPGQLPEPPWGVVLLVGIGTATYLAGKYAEGGRPVVLSVVRAREIGDLPAPIRTGDDIEIRGSGFVPPGAQTPDRLARTVVRIGTVHVPVPLVPVAGGFANPTDGVLTVPVPADVEPGRVEVRVVTAAGVETNGCTIDVVE
ncbi:hypothetical protein [Streptomyces sp. MST-110588]|uniref:hypothetical protein n=1 Tax=Streptomyces sp. MST-110588 TaxID=2833628 RepID=UPI001F5C2396|nr:hypothetical protein [Streptomyces sp. MST-110588]UNO40344.1 hypothetical protein KGS77_13090 [Streptomyces sp. MST-110588]